MNPLERFEDDSLLICESTRSLLFAPPRLANLLIVSSGQLLAGDCFERRLLIIALSPILRLKRATQKPENDEGKLPLSLVLELLELAPA